MGTQIEVSNKKMLNKDLEKVLESRINASGLDVIKKDFQRHNTGIALCNYLDKVQAAIEIYDLIVDSADVYFGIRAEQLSQALIKAVVNTIMEDFSALSLSDIQYSFERYVTPKTDWRNITKFELIAPIQKYAIIKFKIDNEILIVEKENKEEQERKIRADIFLNEAIDMYNESLINGEWNGTIFQAFVIHRKFRKYFSEDEITQIKKDAKNMEFLMHETEDVYKIIGYSFERILAEIVVKKSIKNKYKI